MTPADILRARGKLGPYTRPDTADVRAEPVEPEPVDSAAVRVWAAEHGFDVAPKGRIPASVLDAYRQRKE